MVESPVCVHLCMDVWEGALELWEGEQPRGVAIGACRAALAGDGVSVRERTDADGAIQAPADAGCGMCGGAVGVCGRSSVCHDRVSSLDETEPLGLA